MGFGDREQQRRDDAKLPGKWADDLLIREVSGNTHAFFKKARELDYLQRLYSLAEEHGLENEEVTSVPHAFVDVISLATKDLEQMLSLEEEESTDNNPLSTDELREHVQYIVDNVGIVEELREHYADFLKISGFFGKFTAAKVGDRKAKRLLEQVIEKTREKEAEPDFYAKERELLDRLIAFTASLCTVIDNRVTHCTLKEIEVEKEAEAPGDAEGMEGLSEQEEHAVQTTDREWWIVNNRLQGNFMAAMEGGLADFQAALDGEGGIKVMQEWLQRNPPQKGGLGGR